NLTNSPDLNEDHPTWSPDGQAIAYSALADGIEVVYAKSASNPEAEPTIVDRGRAPTWSPDGQSLVYAIDHNGYTLLVAGRYGSVGVASQAVAVPAPATAPDWTAQTGREFVQALARGSGSLVAEEGGSLYTETVDYVQDAPHYRLVLLQNVDAPNPYLSDRVNDSFAMLRQEVVAASGVDLLGDLEDAFWGLDRAPEPGQAALNWHMTGRAIALNRNFIQGYPPTIEVVREDIGVHTYWRVYVRAAVQDGQLGEPLTALPWDFMSRTSGDVQAYEEGGRLRASIPAGYYVDITQLAEDYGWERLPADRTWRANFGGVLFWQLVKTEGLTWDQAMLELYSADDLTRYLTEPTAFPTATLAPPSPTPEPSHTPTPPPPDNPPAEESG
ncbi:MAG: PD40 domain-containing protein, partial [Anaerolineae bacterium]|nr:PD40 domain-containing protein [Anaerolineae bacterium]